MRFILLRPIFLLCSGLLLLFTTGMVLAAQSTQAQLLKLERVWSQAAQQRDIQALNRILSNDYLDINYQGLVRNKADVLQAPNIKANRYTQTLSHEKVRIYGHTAVVTGLGRLMAGAHTYAWRFTDVFIVRQGRWQAVSSQETPVTHSSNQVAVVGS